MRSPLRAIALPDQSSQVILYMCGVEVWHGGLGAAYLFPALSSAGASIASPCFRFHEIPERDASSVEQKRRF
jgi:hypothetical protein